MGRHSTKIDRSLLRMVDANANRAKEALRVVEDVLRFSLGEKSLLLEARRLRHRMNRVFLGLPFSYEVILGSRNSHGDIGKDQPVRERASKSSRDLFVRNIKRACESVRVLEECCQLFSPKHARSFERLRFSIYELEKKAFRKL